MRPGNNRFIKWLWQSGLLMALAGSAWAGPVMVEKFDRIALEGVYELEVDVGGDYSVNVIGDDDALEDVRVWVEDGTLHFGDKKERSFWNFFRDRDISVEISMPALYGLEIAGIVDGEVTGIDAEEFRLSVSGLGDLELAGRCGVLIAEVSGIGDLNAKKLECREVEVDISGIGDGSFYASETVDADISGIGDVSIHGSPKNVRKNTTVLSDVSVH